MNRLFFKILILFFLCPSCLLAQNKSWRHALEGNLLFTFQPSHNTVSEASPNNTLLTYVYRRFKGYRNPGLNLGYCAQKNVTKKWSLGFALGCHIRYLEPMGNSEYITFYSFPLTVRPEWNCFNLPRHKYYTQLSLGYNFKHPKYRKEDGTGGGTIGLHMIRLSEKNQFYIRCGYDFFQEKSVIEYKADPKLAGTVDETFHYTRYLNQFVFGIGKRLN